EEWPSLSSDRRGQLLTKQGLFISGRPNLDGGDAGLRVVAHVAPGVLYGTATLFLQRILLLYGVVLLLVLVLAWYLAYAGALRRGQEDRIAESEARLRRLSTQLITAQ